MTAVWGGLSASWKRSILSLAVGAVVVGGFLVGRATSDTAHVRVVRGEVERVSIDGVALRLGDREDPDAVFVVGTAQRWTDVDGSTHGPGQPECLPPDSRGAEIELGVIPAVEGGHRNEVVWVRCLTLPTGFVLGDDVAPPPLDEAYQQAIDREG